MESLSIENSFTAINSANTNTAALDQESDELSQADFIELLVAQVKNQDPTEPMDASEFMSQLSQSAAVNGINELQTSFDSLAVKLTSDQSLQAAGLVGKSVLLPGGQGLLETGSSISGQLNLEYQASNVNLNIFNSRGELVKTLPLGGQDAGATQFKWDGFADDGSVAAPGHYLVTAEASISGEQQAVEVLLEDKIESITLDQGANGAATGTLLNLASGQTVSLGDVNTIK